jgi:transposase-like protein
MAHRDSIYRLEGLIKSDDAYVGGKKSGKRGRGAMSKKPILVTVENRKDHAGFVAAEAVDAVSQDSVREFCRRHLKSGQEVRTDALSALNSIGEEHTHEKWLTPPEEAGHCLPFVHIVIGNLKTVLNGTFHGVSHKY